MDIKSLLLKGLSSNTPISGCRRLYFGKSCFVIKFQVRGKYLKIMQITKVRRKHPSLRQRINRRYRLFNRLKHKIKECPHISTRTQSTQAGGHKVRFKDGPFDKHLSHKFGQPNTAMQNKEVQTVKPQIKCCATDTENISLKTTSAQQTIATLRYKLSGSVMKPVTIIPPLLPPTVVYTSTTTQIEIDTVSTGIQCKFRTLPGATQTDEVSVKTSSTQVWSDLVNNDSNKRNCQKSSSNSKSCLEQDAAIYMLNEIGEMVLNQNHIIRNNAKMLSQITEMTMLSKMALLGQTWRKRASKIPPRKCKCIRRAQRVIAEESFRKNLNEMSSKSTQTDEPHQPSMVSQFSQTSFNSMKPRKLSFLKRQK